MSSTPSEPTPSVPAPDFDAGSALLIVTGAHLRAEQADRPLAYLLRDKVRAWIEQHGANMASRFEPLVCSDIWYVNHEPLQTRPTVSIGGPGVNALTAYYAQKLDPAMLAEHKMIIQLDPEFVHLRVAVWGVNHELTVQALEVFISRYLDSYLRAVATQVEPRVD